MNSERLDTSVEQKLLASDAVASLKLETNVYDSFKKLNWQVQHSPYYLDSNTNKYREIDVTARKFWKNIKSPNLACDVDFVVECKTLKNYHIIASNRIEYKVGVNLTGCWIGNYAGSNYSKTIELLNKNNIGNDAINRILKQLNSFCFPEAISVFCNYRVDSFDIPVFNSFRETNIRTTKELDNSIVWKSYLSLHSCAEAYNSFVWDGIDYDLYDFEREEILSCIDTEEILINSLLDKAHHITYVHPVLVVEAKLWEVTKIGLQELKYFRLIFQKLFEHELWIDVVNNEHIEEYIKKAKQYDKFFKDKKFTTG